MTLNLDALGFFQIHQSLARPVVYLDHWAVRRFTDNQGLQDRFISALKARCGTLLFSSQNIAEFCKVGDFGTAQRAENLLARVLPNLYVADFTIDKGFATFKGGPAGKDFPGEGWLLNEILERTKLNPTGQLSIYRFLTDVVTHRDNLLPQFLAMEEGIASVINATRQDLEVVNRARHYRAQQGETLQGMLQNELLREYYLDASSKFGPNDASDLLHAVPSLTRADYVLLDTAWCVKTERARRRLRSHGINRPLAKTFSGKENNLDEFLKQLEG